MDLAHPQALLGGLSPAAFMRRHWQRQPLLVRGAVGADALPVPRAALFALAADDAVESRLVEHDGQGRWRLRHGPLPRRALPPLSRPGWSLLVQGVDLHWDAAHALLSRFAFVPGARLDDLMISWASEGGGVGPHVDSYDVFLLQLQGRRRWRIGAGPAPQPLRLREGLPLKMLADFEPAQQWVLEPGDMLYLPPGWAHDGIAEGGGCMTASIGFRAPLAGELAQSLLQRIAESLDGSPRRPDAQRYRDAGQGATATPAAVPQALQHFAARAVARALADPDALPRALGEWITEPKARVWFDAAADTDRPIAAGCALRLDRRTRMAYDARHVYINGESLRAAGADARLMRDLADHRGLDARHVKRASAAARELLGQWRTHGWLHEAR